METSLEFNMHISRRRRDAKSTFIKNHTYQRISHPRIELSHGEEKAFYMPLRLWEEL